MSARAVPGRTAETAGGDKPAEPLAPASDLAWSKKDTQIVIVILLLAAALRFFQLGPPPDVVFDETYYAKDACLYLGNAPKQCGLGQDSEQSYVHPPLGKWLIALGIQAFGFRSFGWRVVPAIFGSVLPALVYALARKLFENRWIGGVAGVLTATEFLQIVQSRVAMLDIFLAFFVVLGFLYLAYDRAALLQLRNLPPGRPLPGIDRRYRYAAGIALGLASAVKWSATYALAAGGALCLAWTFGLWRDRRKTAPPGPTLKFLLRELLLLGVAFGLVPVLVYLGSYSAWFVDRFQQPCPYVVPGKGDHRVFGEGFQGLKQGECVKGLKGVMLSFGDLHERVYEYHLTLKATHPYQSRAWTWPLVLRPVAYYFNREGNGPVREIIAIGNIVTWYGALISAVWLLFAARRRWRPHRVVAAGWGGQYVPWLFFNRTSFLFYMTPITPFMMIGLAAGLFALRSRGEVAKRLVTGYLILGVGVMTVAFYPVLAGLSIPNALWLRLMWFGGFACGTLRCGWI
jgi:dolichyl-phosphate-mannose-protein mannosyltransferase